MIHIGQLIEQTLKEQGRTVTWFADRLCCTRPNVYKIFKKDNIDIKLLIRISDILQVDFFALYSRQRQERTSVANLDTDV
ncbi:MAG TPA: helix-turn-helix transcriptional regulator [Candidatus Coprenecus pullicola]|jgi:predicted transcriptional regulator|nr:helix-turn-helix transcriptional regulator [Candidatus Coprenecus pullicola]